MKILPPLCLISWASVLLFPGCVQMYVRAAILRTACLSERMNAWRDRRLAGWLVGWPTYIHTYTHTTVTHSFAISRLTCGRSPSVTPHCAHGGTRPSCNVRMLCGETLQVVHTAWGETFQCCANAASSSPSHDTAQSENPESADHSQRGSTSASCFLPHPTTLP